MLDELEDIANRIEEELDDKDTVRELAYKSSRAIIRLSGGAIRAMHRGDDPQTLLTEARDEAAQLKTVVADHKDISSTGFVESAYQELAEAFVLDAIVRQQKLPSHNTLGITSTSYVMGLADVIGELRRRVLDHVRKDDLDYAVDHLEMMEIIYDVLMRFDYPSGMLPVRKKQDVARTLIEKTRGEVTLALRSSGLEKKIAKLEKKLAKK
jgi:translin